MRTRRDQRGGGANRDTRDRAARAVFGNHEPGQGATPETDRLKSRQFPPAFQQVPAAARRRDRACRAADRDRPESETCRGRVFSTAWNACSRAAVGTASKPNAPKRSFEAPPPSGPALAGRCPQQEVGGAGPAREVRLQIRLRNDELALKDALAEQADQPAARSVSPRSVSISIPWPRPECRIHITELKSPIAGMTPAPRILLQQPPGLLPCPFCERLESGSRRARSVRAALRAAADAPAGTGSGN